jgi:hypothetical protein
LIVSQRFEPRGKIALVYGGFEAAAGGIHEEVSARWAEGDDVEGAFPVEFELTLGVVFEFDHVVDVEEVFRCGLGDFAASLHLLGLDQRSLVGSGAVLAK